MSKLDLLNVQINMFIRLAGLIFIALGGVLAYFTLSTPLIIQVSSVFYLISILLASFGTLALISKLE
ncbi:hypothetical protein ACFL96_07760 [Thermoproteota archaeon]